MKINPMLPGRKIKDWKSSLKRTIPGPSTGSQDLPTAKLRYTRGVRTQHSAGAFLSSLPPRLHPKEESISLHECQVNVQTMVIPDKDLKQRPFVEGYNIIQALSPMRLQPSALQVLFYLAKDSSYYHVSVKRTRRTANVQWKYCTCDLKLPQNTNVQAFVFFQMLRIRPEQP